MGVRGLQSYILEHYRLKRHRLHSCKLVVDAANFLHHLHYASHAVDIFGGEYDTFTKHTQLAFDNFVACGVEPLFVFDGAKDWDGPKLQVQLTRAKKRISRSRDLKKGKVSNYNCHLLPLLAYELFIALVKQYSFALICCCIGDADVHMASLAYDLQCSILTNDSDFFIFYLPGGVILSKALYYEKVVQFSDNKSGDCYKYLDCELYNIMEFRIPCLSEHVNPKILPICACLSGNDFLAPGTLNKVLLSKITLPKVSSKLNARHKNMIAMIIWAHRNFTDSYQCLAALSHYLKEADKHVVSILKESLSHYELRHTLTFSTEGQLHFTDPYFLPSCVTDSHLYMDKSVLLLDVLLFGRIMLPQVVEDIGRQSVFLICEKFRRQAYYFELQAAGLSDKFQTVIEYFRKQTEITKFGISIKQEHTCMPPSSHIFLLQELGFEKDVLQSVNLPRKCRLSLYLIRMWFSLAEKEDTTVTARCLYLSLICAVLVHMGKEAGFKLTSFLKFLALPTVNHRQKADVYLVHTINTFQATYLSFFFLASSLDCLLDIFLRPDHLLPCRFLYNLSTDLSVRRDKILYLCELFGRQSPDAALFLQIVSLLD